MRKIANRFLSLALTALVLGSTTLTSCSDEETYAEQKERERDVIDRYIANAGIKVITEREFEEKGYTTDVAANEFVLFSKSGVYMQIKNKGGGEKIKVGETKEILMRFYEYNLNDPNNSTLYNDGEPSRAPLVEKMSVTNNSGTFTAYFENDASQSTPSMMAQRYGNTAVPSGWIVPLSYINIGRPSPTGLAQVELILPHSQGHSEATAQVTPFRYKITFEEGN